MEKIDMDRPCNRCWEGDLIKQPQEYLLCLEGYGKLPGGGDQIWDLKDR